MGMIVDRDEISPILTGWKKVIFYRGGVFFAPP